MIELSWILFCVLVLLQAADVYTTLEVMSIGGHEKWPTTRWLMKKIGTKPALIGSKVVAMLFTGIVTYITHGHWIWVGILILANIIYFIVVKGNWREMK